MSNVVAIPTWKELYDLTNDLKARLKILEHDINRLKVENKELKDEIRRINR